MKNLALFLGIIGVGLFVFLESSNWKNRQLYNDHDHDHNYDQDSEDIWWG